MKMSSAGIAISAALIAGCAATELTEAGMMVREITPGMTSKCLFLGVVQSGEGLTVSITEDRRSAMNKIRNEVAARGGNSFVLNDALTTAAETTMQADAYECE